MWGACLAEKQQLQVFISLFVLPDRGSNQRTTTIKAITLIITLPNSKQLVIYFALGVWIYSNHIAHQNSTKNELKTPDLYLMIK